MVTPRRLEYLGVQSFASALLREYTLSVADATVPDSLLVHARPEIEDFARGESASVGFVIYHRARPAHFILAHLWDGVDLVQRYWTAGLATPQQLRRHRSGAIGCVWELEVIAKEAQAWAAVCEDDNAADAYLARP